MIEFPPMFRNFHRRHPRIARTGVVVLLLAAVIIPLTRSKAAHLAVRLFKYRMNGLDNGIDIPLWQPPSTAVALEGFPDYGPFDADGIPLRDFGRPKGVVYHPLVIAEYGCAYAQNYELRHEAKYAKGLRKMAEWLMEHQQDNGTWNYDWEFRYGNSVLTPPWNSAVTQAQAAQVLMRTARLLDRPDCLEPARRALIICSQPLEKGGLRVDVGKGWFFEEYPSDPPTHVLNAHLRVLVTCAEYLEIDEDAEIREILNRGLVAFHEVLPHFDTGLWTRYDLLPSHRGQSVVIGIDSDDPPNVRWRSIGQLTKATAVKTPNGVTHNGLNYFRVALPVSAATRQLTAPPDLTLESKKQDIKAAYVSWRDDAKRLITLPIDRASDESTAITVPGKFIGLPTNEYHSLHITHLENLAKKLNASDLQDIVNRWKRYATHRDLNAPVRLTDLPTIRQRH